MFCGKHFKHSTPGTDRQATIAWVLYMLTTKPEMILALFFFSFPSLNQTICVFLSFFFLLSSGYFPYVKNRSPSRSPKTENVAKSPISLLLCYTSFPKGIINNPNNTWTMHFYATEASPPRAFTWHSSQLLLCCIREHIFASRSAPHSPATFSDLPRLSSRSPSSQDSPGTRFQD